MLEYSLIDRPINRPTDRLSVCAHQYRCHVLADSKAIALDATELPLAIEELLWSDSDVRLGVVRVPVEVVARVAERPPAYLHVKEPLVDHQVRMSSSVYSALVGISITEGSDDTEVRVFADKIELCLTMPSAMSTQEARQPYCLAMLKTDREPRFECVARSHWDAESIDSHTLMCGSIQRPGTYAIVASANKPVSMPPPPPQPLGPMGTGSTVESVLLTIAVAIVILTLVVGSALLVPRLLRSMGVMAAVIPTHSRGALNASSLGTNGSGSGLPGSAQRFDSHDEETGVAAAGGEGSRAHRRPDRVRRSQTRTLQETDEDLPFLEVSSSDAGPPHHHHHHHHDGATPRRRDTQASGPK